MVEVRGRSLRTRFVDVAIIILFVDQHVLHSDGVP